MAPRVSSPTVNWKAVARSSRPTSSCSAASTIGMARRPSFESTVSDGAGAVWLESAVASASRNAKTEMWRGFNGESRTPEMPIVSVGRGSADDLALYRQAGDQEHQE